MMKCIKGIVAGAVCALAAGASAITWTTDPSKAISTGTAEKTATWTKNGTFSLKYHSQGVTPGKWTSDFAAAKKYADTYHVPMLVFVGSEECGYCALMKSQGLVSGTLNYWISNNPILLVFVEYPSTGALSSDMNSTQVQFTLNGSGLLPLMATYWKKADGSTLHYKFPGRQSKMPSKEGSTCSSQLVGTLNMHFGSWDKKLPSELPDYQGGWFSITGSDANNRLEAVAGKTTYVNVPLYRTEKAAATNKLQADTLAQQSVSWAANVTSQVVRVTLPTGLAAGRTVALKLFDSDGKTVKSTSSVTVVSEPAVSLTNPKWIGEEFSAGEWTMDLDAALAKASAGVASKASGGRAKATAPAAYTLVYASGELWCPYCASLAANLLNKAEFKTWAQRNNVNLVLLDNPKRSADDTRVDGVVTAVGTKPNGPAPTLLRYGAGANGKSGAAYLSRKSIEVGSATAKGTAEYVLQRNHDLLYKGGRLCSPETMRMGYPSVILANPDGTIAATFRGGWDGTTYKLGVAESIDRLNELLKLVGGNMRDSKPSTTTQELAVEADGDGEIQVNANTVFYRLTNVPAGKVTFSATAYDGSQKPVALALDVYETASTLAAAKKLASGTGSVTATFSSGANKYLAVTGYADGGATWGAGTEASLFVGSVVTLVPSQTRATFKTATGRLNLSITSGVKYKLSGFTRYSDFTANDDGTYTAKRTATVAMSAAQGATVAYQAWTPGTVALGKSGDAKKEADGSGTFTLVRTGGVSGKASVTLSVDKGSLGSARVSLPATTFTWNEGDGSAKTVTYRIAANKVFNPDETFTFALAKAGGSDAAVGTPNRLALRVTDSDDPSLSDSAFTLRLFKGVACEQTYPVGNIKEDGRVSVAVTGNKPAGLKVSYRAASKTLAIEGKPKAPGTYRFSVAVTEQRADGAATGQPVAFTVAVVDATSLKPGDKGYNAVVASGTMCQGVIPVFGKVGSRSVLAGTLDTKVTKALSVTAKFTGADGSKAVLKGRISAVPDSGVITARLSSLGGATATVTLSADGKATATVSGLARAYGSTLSSAGVAARLAGSRPYSAYSGYYVVSLPVDSDASALRRGGETCSTGTGYLTLKMNTIMFLKKGKVSYKGMLANGKTLSGAAYLLPDAASKDGDVWGYLPIVVPNKAGNVAGFLLRIRRNAAKDYLDRPEVVFPADDAKPFWTVGGRTLFLNTYGDYYSATDESLVECCEKFYDRTQFGAVFDTRWLPAGTVSAVPRATATVSESGFITVNNLAANQLKLKFVKKSGRVGGSAQVTFANGRTVACKISGVLLVGWADCGCGVSSAPVVERPVFSGCLMFGTGADKRSFAIELQ